MNRALMSIGAFVISGGDIFTICHGALPYAHKKSLQLKRAEGFVNSYKSICF